MTREEKRKWLNRAFEMNKNQPNLGDELKELQSYWERCTDISVKQSEGSRGSSGNGVERSFVNYASASVEYERSVRADIENYYKVKNEIKEVIDKIANPLEKAVLTARFLNYKSIKVIALQLGYHEVYIKGKLQAGIDHAEILT